MLPERDRVFVGQMLEAAQAAFEFTEGLTRDDIERDRRNAFAIVHAVQLVGQAARNVSSETQAALPELPWRQTIGMRNVVVHEYADVDLALVWRTVRDDMPRLIGQLRTLLGDEPIG